MYSKCFVYTFKTWASHITPYICSSYFQIFSHSYFISIIQINEFTVLHENSGFSNDSQLTRLSHSITFTMSIWRGISHTNSNQLWSDRCNGNVNVNSKKKRLESLVILVHWHVHGIFNRMKFIEFIRCFLLLLLSIYKMSKFHVKFDA